MSFEAIAGQAQAKRILQNGLRTGRLSHAYIFSGPAGSGRREMATALTKAIYCTEQIDDSCGQCLNCRKVEHNNHPDLVWIEPDGASIKIDQIRELQKEFAYRATAAHTKIYVLNEADRMTIQAANSLLKFLEEPITKIVAVLITENGHALLPTIQSRAQWISFVPMNPLEMSAILKEEGLPPTLVSSAVHLTAGLKAARELAAADWFAEARNTVLQLAKESLTKLPSAMITLQQKVFKANLAEHMETLIDLWMLWLKDMVRLRCGHKENLVYIDQTDWMSPLALSREVEYWIQGMERAVEVRKRIRFHANPQLTLEKWMIDLQGG
ncbi:DNA polymerase III subunit delta' [Paenibacillus sp. J2TS4]|uniref:DNA polymerase III subunit delta' n=1 Tax=Paenibacillus sp. J2TS4 TaxID=2807194 RepID=UPI001AFE709B|nr:DNA polymerase III subunit delta' [Paenibacillus sp. J2TS4]GIP36312.1 DNA polymerase III subunit delta' [Paenibacillus sp. J2TS4]